VAELLGIMNNRLLNIYLFYCSNCLNSEDLRHFLGGQGKEKTLKAISLPCSGKMELIYLLKSFETDADGVLLITCKQGECRHLEGNLRAKKRAESVDLLLEEIGLGRGCMKVIQMNDEDGVKRVIDEIENLSAAIRE